MVHALVLATLAAAPTVHDEPPRPGVHLSVHEHVLGSALVGAVLTFAAVAAWEAWGPVLCRPGNDRCTPFLWSGEADPRGLMLLLAVGPPLGTALGTWWVARVWEPTLQGSGLRTLLFGCLAALLSPLLAVPIAAVWLSSGGPAANSGGAIQTAGAVWIGGACLLDAAIATWAFRRSSSAGRVAGVSLAPVRTERGTQVVPTVVGRF
jgi:hypothetical protein